MCILKAMRRAFVGHFILTSWRYAPAVIKAIGRLVMVPLVVALVLAAVSPQCDFDDNACDNGSLVANVPDGPGAVAARTAPDRARIGHDPASPLLTGDGLVAVWPALPPLPALPLRPPRPAWYPRWTVPALASNPAETPDLPPRI